MCLCETAQKSSQIHPQTRLRRQVTNSISLALAADIGIHSNHPAYFQVSTPSRLSALNVANPPWTNSTSTIGFGPKIPPSRTTLLIHDHRSMLKFYWRRDTSLVSDEDLGTAYRPPTVFNVQSMSIEEFEETDARLVAYFEALLLSASATQINMEDVSQWCERTRRWLVWVIQRSLDNVLQNTSKTFSIVLMYLMPIRGISEKALTLEVFDEKLKVYDHCPLTMLSTFP